MADQTIAKKNIENTGTEAEAVYKNYPLIAIKDLNVIYYLGKVNEFYALKNINLEIYSGEFIIFFGPSGCGKSTLLYSMAGLETNIQGEVSVGGRNINKMEPEEVEEYHRKKIGMIFQAYYLIDSLNVLSNVILPQIFIGGDGRRGGASGFFQEFLIK